MEFLRGRPHLSLLYTWYLGKPLPIKHLVNKLREEYIWIWCPAEVLGTQRQAFHGQSLSPSFQVICLLVLLTFRMQCCMTKFKIHIYLLHNGSHQGFILKLPRQHSETAMPKCQVTLSQIWRLDLGTGIFKKLVLWPESRNTALNYLHGHSMLYTYGPIT